MSVAKCLGVDDINAPNMRELRAEWQQWTQMSSDLPDVDDLKDLPRWMQEAEPTRRDEVLKALRRIAEGDRRVYVAQPRRSSTASTGSRWPSSASATSRSGVMRHGR